MRQRWIYLGLLTVALTLLVGTGSYSAVSADRGADIAVVPDEHAYLGIETEETTGTVGESVHVLTLSDNFASDVDLDDVRIVDAVAPVTLIEPSDPQELEPSTPVTVTCDGVGEGEVTFEIAASGPGVTVEATKTVSMSCEPQPIQPSDVTFHGCGNAEIHGHESQFPLSVTLLGYDAEGVSETTATVTEPGGVTGGSRGQLIGLRIQPSGPAVTNPNFDFAGRNCRNASEGNPATGESGDPRDRLDS